VTEMSIHPTATIFQGARIAHDVEIGAYAIIGSHVQVEEGCRIAQRVVIEGKTHIMGGTSVGSGSVIGAPAQIVAQESDEAGWVKIGRRVNIGTYVTIHAGAKPASCTSIGEDCLLMPGCHIGHNVTLGKKATVEDNCLLGGFVEIGECARLGAASVYHQFSRVGCYADVSAAARCVKDIPPYVLARDRGRVSKINVAELQLAGFSAEEVSQIESAFALIYHSRLNVSQALKQVHGTAWCERALDFFRFIEASKRGVSRKSEVSPAYDEAY